MKKERTDSREGATGQGLYPIAVASQLTGLSARTLRLYEQDGLIRPQRPSKGGRRLYSEQDITWVRCIQELVHEHGLTTTAIRRLLDLIPCWEIKRCAAGQMGRCAPLLNIPNMATGKDSGAPQAGESEAEPRAPAGEKPVEFRLFFGVAEFGTVFSCTRCIQAERIIRRLAAKHGIAVEIHKHDILSEEAERFGIVLTPTIMLNGEVISAGKALSEAKLERFIRPLLAS